MGEQLFKEGDKVYFKGYDRENFDHKERVFDGNTPAVVREVNYIEGDYHYMIENRKGQEDRAFGHELAPRGNQEASPEALEQTEKEETIKPGFMNDAQVAEHKEESEIKKMFQFVDGSVIEYQETEDVKNLLAANNNNIGETLKDLDKKNMETYWLLGQFYSQVAAKKLYRAEGYTGPGAFNRWADENGTSFGSRQGRFLINLYNRLTALGYTIQDALDIGGWSKCSIIAEAMTPDNHADLVEKAKSKQANGKPITVAALREYVSNTYRYHEKVTMEELKQQEEEQEDDAQYSGERLRTVSLQLTDSAYSMMESAMAMAGQQFSEYQGNKSKLMEMIVQDWLTKSHESGRVATKEDHINHLHHAFPHERVFFQNIETGEVTSPSYINGTIKIEVVESQNQEELAYN